MTAEWSGAVLVEVVSRCSNDCAIRGRFHSDNADNAEIKSYLLPKSLTLNLNPDPYTRIAGFIPMMVFTASGFTDFLLSRPNLAFIVVTLISMVFPIT